MSCDHEFKFQGTVYWPDNHPLPGSGAHAMHYGDKYYCARCLDQKIVNDRIIGNTYTKPVDGTMPR